MICLECNQVVKQLSYRHLQKCCGLLPREYKNKWNTELYDSNIKLKCSSKLEKNGNWKGGITYKKYYCIKCKNEITGRGITKLCSKCSKIGELNHFYNKKHTLKTRKRMIEKAKKRDKSMYYKIIQTPKLRQMASIRMKKYHKEGKYDYAIKKWIEAGVKTKKNTKIEKILNKILSGYGMIENIDYKRNFQIGKYNVDFLIRNTYIIECFGDYWHKNPLYYSDSISKIKNHKDMTKQQYLEKLGYQYINLWETDIHNAQYVHNELKIFFKSFLNLFEWESCSI